MAATPDSLASDILQRHHFLKTTFYILANKRTMSTALMNIHLNSHYIIYSPATLPKSPFANFPPNYYVSSGEKGVYLLSSVIGLYFLKTVCYSECLHLTATNTNCSLHFVLCNVATKFTSFLALHQIS